MIVDSHVNLHAGAFDADRDAVIARAWAAGVGTMLTICDRLDRWPEVRAVADAHDDIWCTVGVHPHEAKDFPYLEAGTLIDLCAHPKVVALGECGLDHHYDLSPPAEQARVFSVHLEAAQATGLPVVVHTREADAQTADMLEAAHARGPLKLLLHCYTGGAELARRAAALGAWFSVSGIATFKAAEEVRAVIRDMPADRILVETDCPYLAPVPHRGRRNEPAYLPHVLAKLAELRGWSLQEAECRTEAAFFALFDCARRPAGVEERSA